MRKNKSVAALAVAMAVAVSVAGCGNSSTSASSGSVAASEKTEETVIEVEPEPEAPKPLEFTPIEVKTPINNDIHISKYLEATLSDGRSKYERAKSYAESLNLQPYLDENGNQMTLPVFGNKIYAMSRHTIDNGDETIPVILSGVEVMNVNDDMTPFYPHMTKCIREEGTGERLYYYESAAEYDHARLCRQVGQRILNGEVEAPERCVILNGSLVDTLHYNVEEDGTITVSLRALATTYDPGTEFLEEWQVLNVPAPYANAVGVPCTETANRGLEQREYYQIQEDNTYTFDSFDSGNAGVFTLPVGTEFVMPVEDIASIYDWDFWIADNVLKVETDTLDDTAIENFRYTDSRGHEPNDYPEDAEYTWGMSEDGIHYHFFIDADGYHNEFNTITYD